MKLRNYMSDNLSFLYGGGLRSTVGRPEGEAAGLREWWGCGVEMPLGAEPNWGWGPWICSGLICTAM